MPAPISNLAQNPSKLTVGASTPKVNPAIASGISLLPGSRNLGGQFIPAPAINPTTSYVPVTNAEIPKKQTSAPTPQAIPGLLGGKPLINNQVQTAKPTPAIPTLPFSGAPAPAKTASTPSPFSAQTTGYNPQTGAQFNTAGVQNPVPQVPPTPSAPPISYGGLIGNVVNSANRNQQVGQNAADIANRFGQQIADVGQQGAKAEAGYLTTGTNPVGEGNAAVVNQSVAAQQQALAQGESAALQGTSQQITANQNQTTGLTGAANLAQPQLAGFNQQSFDPTTGQFSGGGNVDSAVASVAQKVQNGTMSYDQAASELSPYGVQGTNALRAALGSNFNVNQSNSNATIQGEQNAQVQRYTSAFQQGKNLQSQLSDLITTFGLNPNDVNAANVGLQAIARNTSDPRYQLLQNYVNDIANTYSQILTPTGGVQTDSARDIATSMLNATASGESILKVMQGLDNAAQAKIAGVKTMGGTQGSSQFSGAAWK